MRTVQNPQMSIGQVDIAGIKLDPKSRDDIPAILVGLQHIYMTPALHDSVFEILQQIIPKRSGEGLTDKELNEDVSSSLGRPGMEQWKILVLGVLRLGLNTDYDRIHELANNHTTIRQMLGHSDWCDETQYSLQAIKDNLMLFTPEILDQINQEVIKAGHSLVKKSHDVGQTGKNKDLTSQDEKPVSDKLRGRCDSFVLETNIHFPTDLSLLWDATRKAITESARLAENYEIPGWRQFSYNLKQLKKLYRRIQIIKHSTSQDETKKLEREEQIKEECTNYIEMAEKWITRTEQLIEQLKDRGILAEYDVIQLNQYQTYAHLFIDQINRRVILDEKIPHSEKVFSIFEPHTEWISKGKAGVPVELGLRVCIMEDQHQFILHSKVMERLTDDKIAIEMVTETKERFAELAVVSFDKGFHRKTNQKELKELLEQVILPKKGRLSETDKLREGNDEFKKLRNHHSGVESAINGLEQGGLDVCPDHGIDGFKRYVSLAVLSRNIKRLGAIIRKQAQEKEDRKRGQYKRSA
jgi:hypothetical protein